MNKAQLDSLYTLMKSAPAITGLAGGRLYFERAPQDCKAARVVYSEITDTPGHVHGSELGGKAFVQIDVYARSAEDALAIAESLHSTLTHYRGAVIQLILRKAHRKGYEDGPELYRVSNDYEIHT